MPTVLTQLKAIYISFLDGMDLCEQIEQIAVLVD